MTHNKMLIMTVSQSKRANDEKGVRLGLYSLPRSMGPP